MNKILSKMVLVCFVFSMIIGPAVAETTTSEASEQKSFISAEARVQELAIKSKNNRELAGSLLGLWGLLGTWQGVTYIEDPSSFFSGKPLMIWFGVLLVAMGATYYFIPTGIEKDYLFIDKLDKATTEGIRARELLAEKSLKDRSADAANGRMWGSILWTGLGAFYLTKGAEQSGASLLCGGLALFTWFNKSDIEQEYEKYMGDKELLKKGLSADN
jgi:hypothetical protein